MKKMILAALAASAAIASPVMAQTTTGTVDVTGSVQSKCTAQSPISGTITLGELAKTDGTVDGTFSSQSGGLSRSFSVVCTSANVQLKLSSDALNNQTDQTTGSGYTGRVHYTSTLTAKKANSATDASAVYTTADSLPAETAVSLGDRLKNTPNNVTVAVSAGTTTNGADILKAGSYKSTITITVAPI